MLVCVMVGLCALICLSAFFYVFYFFSETRKRWEAETEVQKKASYDEGYKKGLDEGVEKGYNDGYRLAEIRMQNERELESKGFFGKKSKTK